MSLQQVLATSQQARRQIHRLQPPITAEQQEEFFRHWRLQFVAWNNYAASARRLVIFLQQQRQPSPE